MKTLTRPFFFSLGIGCVALGAVGALLPVLPTTPFLILALWCFTRSSKRFHDWLYYHKLFGPTLQRWDRHRVIPLKAKVFAVSSMILSAAYVFFFIHPPVFASISMLLFMGYGSYFILSKPSNPPKDA